jgi:hypothetical protein
MAIDRFKVYLVNLDWTIGSEICKKLGGLGRKTVPIILGVLQEMFEP